MGVWLQYCYHVAKGKDDDHIGQSALVTVHTQPNKTRVLVVEDDEITQTIVTTFLEQENHSVTCVTTAREMHAVLNKHVMDLILLDLNLPDEDGLTLARQIRTRSSVPIIIMTSRSEMDDRLIGLEIGADDFLTKPFDPRELVLRVRNVLRRTSEHTETKAQNFAFGDWKLDLPSRSLNTASGEDISLTPGEFNVLSALVQAEGRVLSRDFLLDAVAHDDTPPSDRMIDVFVSRLRKKIEKNPRSPVHILTVPGYGYKFSG